MANKALFLDRDGVINIEKNYVYKIEDFEFVEGIFEVMLGFQAKGYLLFVITNQAGIGRGYYTDDDFHKLNTWMLKELSAKNICVEKVYYSPYHAEFGLGDYKKDSECRKPNPGMILQAMREYDLDLKQSVLIGDKQSDIEAGERAGVRMNIKVTANENCLNVKAIRQIIMI